jgi:hypothetical protein
MIPKTALDLGVITSLDIVKSNDQAGIKNEIPEAEHRYTAITDTKKVPLVRPGRTVAGISGSS